MSEMGVPSAGGVATEPDLNDTPPANTAGKRQTRKVHSDGTVSWEVAADSGEVEDEDEDEDVDNITTLKSEQEEKEKVLADQRRQRLMARLDNSKSKFAEAKSVVRQLATGHELSVGLLQKEGFANPILVADKDGLGLKVPPSTATVTDVRAAVGSRRLLDVMDVNTQKNRTMTMKDWHKYYETPQEQRTESLNVISLEFSNTKLDNQVISPRVVRQIDWIDKVWPRHLKEMQVEATNSIDDMMYPKVQKYCLMSVSGCWTDFHIDLGGTSVWYHILKGQKVFYLIPPTDDNLRRYEEWVLSGKQSETFFADLVQTCAQVQLEAGSTFFIPSGWIHAVYTPMDSLVFGGNFLHSFSMEKQLQVAHIEEVTRVPHKFRFPFYTEMLWYMLDRYVHCLLNRTHLDLPEEEKRRLKLEKGENIDPNKEFLHHQQQQKLNSTTHMTQFELHGIKFVVMYLHHLPASKKNVPVMLPDPIAVIKDVRQLVLDHKEDCPERAITGKYILRWTESDDVDNTRKPRKSIPKALGSSIIAPPQGNGNGNGKKKLGRPPKEVDVVQQPSPASNNTTVTVPVASPNSLQAKKLAAGNRRRRVRCKTCEACLGGDCKMCVYCKDMTKYGGPGRMKQTCEKRRCLHPQLPVCAYCSHCRLDGWFNEPKVQGKETERPEDPPNLFECTVCLDIIHPQCAEKTIGLGKVNPDLSNSWECARCANSGYSTVPSRTTHKRHLSGELEEESGGVKRPKEDMMMPSPGQNSMQ